MDARLEDKGTRFQHLMDLREVWQNGIESIMRLRPQYRSKADEDIMKSLHIAVSFIDKQVDLMSRYDLKQYD